MKKFITVVVLSLVIIEAFLSSPSVFALPPSEESGDPSIRKYESKKDLKLEEQRIAEKEETYLKDKIDLLNAVTLREVHQEIGQDYIEYLVPVVVNRQEKFYYCGPAAVKTVLGAMGVVTESQEFYATNMNTDIEGFTWNYKLRDELNNYQNQNSFASYYIDTETKSDFKGYLDWSFKLKGFPVVYSVRAHELYKYNDTEREIYHYVTGSGMVEYNSGLTELRITDSWYIDYGRGSVLGNYYETLDSVYGAIKGRPLIW